MTIEMDIPVNEVPNFKQAARELDIDVITESGSGDKVKAHLLVFDYYQLVCIGALMGINQSYQSIQEPLKEMIDSVEQKVADFKAKNPGNE